MGSTPATHGDAVPQRRFGVEGLSCASCVLSVETALKSVPGVEQATVNLATHTAYVQGSASARVLQKAVKDAGYALRTLAEDGSAMAPDEERRHWLRRLVVAGALSVPLMVLAMGPFHGVESMVVQALLATVVTLGTGWPFFRAAAVQARHLRANMDTLVAVGSLSALGYSVAQLLRTPSGPHDHAPHLYFETAGMIVSFILAGRYLEARAKQSASEAIRALMALRPTGVRVRRNGVEVEVPAADLAVGELVLLRPGERVPADGVVEEGATELDESLMTGESMPVPRVAGDRVLGGSVNLTGAMAFRATGVGRNTALGHIVDLVENAQASKTDVQRLADKVSSVFVPAVLALSGLTLLGWLWSGAPLDQAVMLAVSVTVIACPCALGLATPTAVMVGTGRAAALGILIRDARALERAGLLTALVLDKTGTLTRGQPHVVGVRALAAGGEDALLGLAAAVEHHSEHPLGRAVVALAKSRGAHVAPAAEARAQVGGGMEAKADGRVVRVGTRAFVEGLGGQVPAALLDTADGWTAAARTVIFVGDASGVLGALALEDEVREDSAGAVAALTARGVKVVLCTGDNQAVARAVAARVGIAPGDVVAGAQPADKVATVRALKAAGLVVGFVGDGINDAPALAAADVGMALGMGADVAQKACDVTLLRPSIQAAADCMTLSRGTLRIIRQNLGWALGYNAVCLPLAITGVLASWGGPMLAAAAMAFSSVSVVVNSLRLRHMPLA